MRKTVNIVKKMRTTNCKISIFSGVTSDVCKIHFNLPFTKKIVMYFRYKSWLCFNGDVRRFT